MSFTCKDCKHFFQELNYCTNFWYKVFPPDNEICGEEWFEEGVFNNRFYIWSKPKIISTGNYFILVDRSGELVDDEGNFLSFNYIDEVELLCAFLNNFEDTVKNLRKFCVNKVEEEYWRTHNPITD